jgi:hypothetical protein
MHVGDIVGLFLHCAMWDYFCTVRLFKESYSFVSKNPLGNHGHSPRPLQENNPISVLDTTDPAHHA